MERTYAQDRAIVDALTPEQLSAVMALTELHTHGSDYDSGRYVSARVPYAGSDTGYKYSATPLLIPDDVPRCGP